MFLDRQVWTNSVDPDQTAPEGPAWSESTILPFRLHLLTALLYGKTVWAMTWQNQQSECAPSKDSDQPEWVCAQQRLRSAWASAQADLSLCWAHTHFDGFVMSRLILLKSSDNYSKFFSGKLFWLLLQYQSNNCISPHTTNTSSSPPLPPHTKTEIWK